MSRAGAPSSNQRPPAVMLTVVSAVVPQRDVAALADLIAEAGVSASAWEDWEGGDSRIEIFLEDAGGAPGAVQELKLAGNTLGLALEPLTGTLAPEDWTEIWKRFFHTERVSPRLVVRPPWESYEPADGELVVVMDPGMSFGTGRHATTQACMKLLDELADGDLSRSVLDIGCGSGILSIAAAKLGFSSVRGFDNDADAVRIATENASINGVDVAYNLGDLSSTPQRGDIVVANVLAEVLREHVAAVASAVNDVPGNALLLSGILDVQYPAVAAAYTRLGFRERESLLIGEWRNGWFERRGCGAKGDAATDMADNRTTAP